MPDHPTDAELHRLADDSLDEPRAAEIAAHLEACEACEARLEVVEPPAVLPAADESVAWDATRTRRAVRRTILRTAVDVLLLAAIIGLTWVLLTTLVYQPLIVDRGERASRTVAASIDLPVLTTPGAQLAEWETEAAGLRRTTTVEVGLPVGPTRQPHGSLTTHLGAWGATVGPPGILPFVGVSEGPLAPFDPARAAPGTAVTVHLTFEDPVKVDAAEAISAADDDVELVWVGFDVAGTRSDVVEAHEHLAIGWSACQRADDLRPTGSLGGSTGMSTSGTGVGPGVGGAAFALEQARIAADRIAGSELDGATPQLDIDQVIRDLRAADPPVTSIVLTGSSPAVIAVLDDVDAEQVELLAMDFDTGPPLPCGG